MPDLSRIPARFWKNIIYSSYCWEWKGYKNHDGYGMMSLSPKTAGTSKLAHRHIWEILVGPIPKDMIVCHKCDNTGCVRIDHLFITTQQGNQMDCIVKGRRPRESSCALPKLTKTLARKIRGEWKDVPTTHLAKRLKVSRVLIRKVRQGRAWKED